MTRTVYAADNYTPPSGVIVLPLEHHPAIIEDAQWRWTNTNGRRGYRRKAPLPLAQVAQRVVEYLQAYGESPATEIAKALNLSRGGVYRTLMTNPHLFDAHSERRSCSNRWKSVAVWALVEQD